MLNIKLASISDRDAAVGLVRKLLAELGGTPPSAEDMSPVFARFAGDGEAGFIVMGENDGACGRRLHRVFR